MVAVIIYQINFLNIVIWLKLVGLILIILRLLESFVRLFEYHFVGLRLLVSRGAIHLFNGI